MSAVSHDEVASLLVEESRRSPRDTLVIADVASIRITGGKQ